MSYTKNPDVISDADIFVEAKTISKGKREGQTMYSGAMKTSDNKLLVVSIFELSEKTINGRNGKEKRGFFVKVQKMKMQDRKQMRAF